MKRKNKTSRPIVKALLKNHDPNNVYEITIQNDCPWHKTLRQSSVSGGEGLLLFLDGDNEVIYVGQTEYIHNYANIIHCTYGLEETRKIFVINNENPSSLIHAADAYRSLFRPKYNSNRSPRFTYNKDISELHLPKNVILAIRWIKKNPNACKRHFYVYFGVVSDNLFRSLCKIYNTTSYNAIKNSIIRVC